MRVQKQRGNGAALSAKGGKTVKERDLYAKNPAGTETIPLVLLRSFASLSWGFGAFIHKDNRRRNRNTHNIVNYTKKHITDILGFERHQE